MAAPRFDMDARTLGGVATYFENRAEQGLAEGWRWSGRVETLCDERGEPWGARTFADDPHGVTHQSVYVLAQRRGEGHLSRHAGLAGPPFVTGPDCDLERFFARRGVAYVVAGAFTQTPEYRAIEARHGTLRAKRSGVLYMNHLDEGLAVLRDLGATDRARRAWCLHPLVQMDDELARTYPDIAAITSDPQVLALAMEYRNVANACLSHRVVASASEIALSPLAEVNDMLRADKVQNYKDFLIHHDGTHPRSDALHAYFARWLERLGVDRAAFARWFDALQVRPEKVGLHERP